VSAAQRDDDAPARRSRKIPLEHAVLWRPLWCSNHLLVGLVRPDQRRFWLFAAQQALAAVQDDAAERGAQACGLLAGALYECPTTGVEYQVIGAARALADAGVLHPAATELRHARLREAREALDADGQTVLGWYAWRPRLETRLEAADEALFASGFERSYHVGLALSPQEGGIFAYERKLGRSFSIPFRELLPPDGSPSDEPPLSVVGWDNYVSAVPVRRLQPAERGAKRTLSGALPERRGVVAGAVAALRGLVGGR
jgi:hypothetical protein